jgi:hypothetical protein
MSDGSVVWAKASEEEGDEAPETQAHAAEVDETFAQRRLRRWLKGMFGGPAEPRETPHDDPEP